MENPQVAASVLPDKKQVQDAVGIFLFLFGTIVKVTGDLKRITKKFCTKLKNTAENFTLQDTRKKKCFYLVTRDPQHWLHACCRCLCTISQ